MGGQIETDITGGLLSMFSNQAAAGAQAQIAKQNAEMALRNASFTSQEGEANAFQKGLANRGTAGRIKSAQAAGGIDVNSGSAAKVQQSQDLLAQLDVNTIRSNAARAAYGYQTKATQFENQAALDKAQEKEAVPAGIISTYGSVLSSAASAGSQYAQWQEAGG